MSYNVVLIIRLFKHKTHVVPIDTIFLLNAKLCLIFQTKTNVEERFLHVTKTAPTYREASSVGVGMATSSRPTSGHV